MSGEGLGGEVRKVFLAGRWVSRLESSADHAGVALVPRVGAPCRCAVREEYLGSSEVSVVLSCVCRCPERAPGAGERMVFLFGGGG